MVRRVKHLDQRVDEVTRELEAHDRLLKETLMVAGTTLDGAIQRRTEASPFDTVVIDEAGTIPLPKAVAVATTASARLVMVGDFRQLPAVTAAEFRKPANARERALD